MMPGRYAKDPTGENMAGSDGVTTWVLGGEEHGGQMEEELGGQMGQEDGHMR